MKKIRAHHVVASLVLFGTLVAGSGVTGSSMAAGTGMPPGTNVTPSSAYVAPTAAGTKLGQYNIARFEEIVKQGLNEGDLSVIDTHVSPTVVDHQFYGPGYPRSRGGIKALTAALRTGFPDLHAVPTTLVASNNGTQTFAIIRTTGTNTGSYLGVPPTGRKVVINIEESALWKDGVMVEHWGVVDNIGLLAQMGLFPLDQFPSFDVKRLAKQYQQQLAHPPTLHYRTATTPQAKLAAATRSVKAVAQGNMFADSEIVAPNYVDYEYYGQGYPSKAVDKHKMAIGVNKTALPNLHTSIHELQVIGPQVFGILEATGTNTGPFITAPATGRKVDFDLFEYWHFNSKGQVDVHNGIADLFGLVSQLGWVNPAYVPRYSPSKVDRRFLPELKKG
jgi:predicted ester cyclase